MVYIISWDDFVEKSVQLFRADPERTRYSMKYRHCDGKLVLKVTDDKEANAYCEVMSSGRSYVFRNRLTPITVINQLLPGECIKFKTDQAQEAKKMEKLNNLFFTLMARGPEVDLSEVGVKEQTEAQPPKKGRGRKQ